MPRPKKRRPGQRPKQNRRAYEYYDDGDYDEYGDGEYYFESEYDDEEENVGLFQILLELIRALLTSWVTQFFPTNQTFNQRHDGGGSVPFGGSGPVPPPATAAKEEDPFEVLGLSADATLPEVPPRLPPTPYLPSTISCLAHICSVCVTVPCCR